MLLKVVSAGSEWSIQQNEEVFDLKRDDSILTSVQSIEVAVKLLLLITSFGKKVCFTNQDEVILKNAKLSLNLKEAF